MQELTYENIVHNLGVKIQAIQNEIQQLRDTKGLGFDKFGRMISLETDLKYYQMLKTACEKQVAKKPIETTDGMNDYIFDAHLCTRCDERIFTHYNYCPDCGQKSDWGKK